MAQLANFSVEDNDKVLLKFQDGRERLASIDELHKHVSGADHQRIRKALKLRADYVRKHLPPWAKVIMIAVLVGFLGAGMTKAATIVIHHLEPTSQPATAQTSQPQSTSKVQSKSRAKAQLKVAPPPVSTQAITIEHQLPTQSAAKAATNPPGLGISGNIGDQLQPITGHAMNQDSPILQPTPRFTKDLTDQLGL